jgi:hypothetical protein
LREGEILVVSTPGVVHKVSRLWGRVFERLFATGPVFPLIGPGHADSAIGARLHDGNGAAPPFGTQGIDQGRYKIFLWHQKHPFTITVIQASMK